MPQLAPLSWILISFLVFFCLFSFAAFVWWMNKKPLVLLMSSKKLCKGYFWAW